MKLQLIARHLRDDQDHVLAEEHAANFRLLYERMRKEIEENKAEGSNWRFFITPTEEAYAI